MSPLIEIADLRVYDPEIKLIDVRAGAYAHQRYLAGHMPNAIFATLDANLASKAKSSKEGNGCLPP